MGPRVLSFPLTLPVTPRDRVETRAAQSGFRWIALIRGTGDWEHGENTQEMEVRSY
jgi:hypothetical protein